jgi:ubiquinol-cytochrome c reductase cytochrome b subunit
MIVLSVMGKVPPMGLFNTIGLVAALTFIGLWIVLPLITMIEKKIKD